MGVNRFQKKRYRKTSLKKYFYGGLFLSLIIGLIYFIIWSPYLRVESIGIEGSVSYSQEIREMVQKKIAGTFFKGGLPRKSIVLTPINQIRDDILERYSEIKDVVVVRQWPNTLNIQIQQRENIGVWCQIEYREKEPFELVGEDEELELATSTEEIVEKEREINQCFHFDSEGVIFREAPLISGSLILNVYGTKSPVKIRDKVISEEMIKFILDVREDLPEIKIASESLPEVVDFEIISLEDLRVTTAQDWQIYFNPTYSVELQLEALRIVIEKEIKETLSSLEYIDLKIQGRVYYK